MPIANPAGDALKNRFRYGVEGSPAWHLPFRNNRMIVTMIA
jgi:hypothetical protein